MGGDFTPMLVTRHQGSRHDALCINQDFQYEAKHSIVAGLLEELPFWAAGACRARIQQPNYFRLPANHVQAVFTEPVRSRSDAILL